MPRFLIKILRVILVTTLGLGVFCPAPARAQTVVQPPASELVGSVGVFNVLNSTRETLAAVEWRLPAVGPLQLRPWFGLADTDHGAWYLSAGLLYTRMFETGWRLSVGFAPTYYQAHHDQRLGGNFAFNSFGEAAYAFANGHALSIRFGHLSNAGLRGYNPGTEVIMLSWSVPLR